MSVNFNDLHDKMFQSKSGLISKEDFFEWVGKNIEINTYIPITKKYALIRIFSDKFSDMVNNDLENEDNDYIFLIYDINQVFVLLFAYTDMIILSQNRTIDNYDLIMESGLFDYIMKFCEKDYKLLIEKCDKVTGINDLNILKQFVSSIGNQPTVEDMKKIRDIINNEIDSDKLEIIKAVQEYNNPALKKIVDITSNKVMRDIISKEE